MKLKTGILIATLFAACFVLVACSNDSATDTTFKTPPPKPGVTPPGAKTPEDQANAIAKGAGNTDTGGDDKGK